MKTIFSTSYGLEGTGLSYISRQTAGQLQRKKVLSKIIAPLEKNPPKELEKKIEHVKIHPSLNHIFQATGLNYMGKRNLFDLKAKSLIGAADIFHGYSHESLCSLRQAKKLGAKTYLDHPNAHLDLQNRLLLEEAKKFKANFKPYNHLELLKARKEFEEADRILVLSSFAKESFLKKGFEEEKIIQNHYGVDSKVFRPQTKEDGIFRVVFTGQIGLRKGVPYLLEAWQQLNLKEAELVMVGWKNQNIEKVLAKYDELKNVKILEPTEDLEAVARIFGQGSVGVFPSIEDGFAMTVTEAMACALPVIVTENTGAKDLVEEGRNGFITPIREVKLLKERLLSLYQSDRERAQMGKRARQTALKNTWDDYGNRLVKAYDD